MEMRPFPVPSNVDLKYLHVQWHVGYDEFDRLAEEHGIDPGEIREHPRARVGVDDREMPAFRAFDFRHDGVWIRVFGTAERRGRGGVVVEVESASRVAERAAG